MIVLEWPVPNSQGGGVDPMGIEEWDFKAPRQARTHGDEFAMNCGCRFELDRVEGDVEFYAMVHCCGGDA